MAKKTNKRLRCILKRDGRKCGIHSEGCRQPIVKISDATLDHIIPKGYTRQRGISLNFQGNWNYQPMHKECNAAREGQLIDWPKFTCRCHGIYIDERGNRWVMYEEDKIWEMAKYWKSAGDRDYTKLPAQPFPRNVVHIAVGKQFGQSGMSIKRPGSFGHAFYPVDFYERMGRNGSELDRTQQWGKLLLEVETFKRHYLSDGGKSLNEEAQQQSTTAIEVFKRWEQKAHFNLMRGLVIAKK